MTTIRLTFLSHFVICLACMALAFFAWINGVPQTIWANDLSMMTSVIGMLFVGTALALGRQAWLVDGRSTGMSNENEPAEPAASTDLGHLAERLCVMAGFVGTAIGLSLQAKSLAGGATSFTALATSLYTTACGGAAAALIAVLTYSLEAGIRRARR
jgi:hypothetical protein